ncbi:9783_t:CDS:2 [Paraglomus brasilianum]|uniref:9783_t:CDS:1 n=1 Tax=Paraglomus brasilianum TaxID=144538 RepID=A0A9N9A6E8_9GLOM|nr:9783_t:CDS:2 [Paraglomus brasilianum]
MGKGLAFDSSKFFIFCANVMGSPYGTASSVTIDPDTGRPYGPEFPQTTIRDDVRLHKKVLDMLGVKQVAICLGGSMGGMQVLEWAFFGPDYVCNIVPIATSARHSAWCISWGEAQRQAIYSDPKYLDGYYSPEDPPATGLSAARMSALLTYRSRDSFESRFGRKYNDPKKHPHEYAPRVAPSTPAEHALLVHNDGNKSENIMKGVYFNKRGDNSSSSSEGGEIADGKHRNNEHSVAAVPNVFSAQSYLRYQGNKFVKRFDANCYISISRKMDTHDIANERGEIEEVLGSIRQPTMVIGIESDGLYTISEQYELAKSIPNAEMVTIQSPDGHDGFLLEFDQINRHILRFIRTHLPRFARSNKDEVGADINELKATKSSLFGEAEMDDMLKW